MFSHLGKVLYCLSLWCGCTWDVCGCKRVGWGRLEQLLLSLSAGSQSSARVHWEKGLHLWVVGARSVERGRAEIPEGLRGIGQECSQGERGFSRTTI